ncbi:MAG: hypothetical protein JO070_06805 [Verrucomicrobia bacterium]|nr:hypothetical protein [Verrucomicrobiota bacterium]
MRRLATILGVAGLLAAAILFGAWFLRQQGQGQLVWDRPTVKKTIQTFAYKVYGNSHLESGRYFMSKMVFRNTGKKAVTEFSVSYQIPGYIDWTTPDALPQIPPGHTVIKCFYPQFPKKVTEIKNDTPSALETKIRWNDGSGPIHEEVVRDEFIFRGVNEIEWTDLPSNEIVNWFDDFVNSDLLAAMVTPNDPVVTEYAAAITEKLGGALAGAGGDKDKIAVMAGLYNYMIETGMRYAGGMGFPETVGDTHTTVQTVRLPRDVILSNNGLCIELTLLWASVLEHLGMASIVFVIPGHAFIVVPLENELNGLKLVPIECTAITPKAVDRQGLVSFPKAYEMALGELAKALKETGVYIAVKPQQLQIRGIVPPELPDINIDQVKRIIASRKPVLLRR